MTNILDGVTYYKVKGSFEDPYSMIIRLLKGIL
jgi:hypothetical protein